MPAEAMTFSSLVDDIKRYCDRNNSEFITQIPRFIMLAENRIASEVRGLGYVRVAESALVSGEPTVAKPARWRETGSFFITDLTTGIIFLKNRGYTFARTYWPIKANTDQPLFYTDYDYEHFLITPTPDANYAFEMLYYERPVPLATENETNWTTQYAPQLLLYSSLLEAQIYLKREDRIPTFEQAYAKAAAAVTMESQRRLMGDQSLARSEG